MGTNSDSG